MEINKDCQVFTPEESVRQLLDKVGYNHNLYNQKVAENSCGDGSILGAIVVRYIEDCLINNLSKIEIKAGLERDIYGAEIDKNHLTNCINKLNKIADKYEINDVQWKVYHGDFLKLKLTDEFDFVIGNPPYISYQDLTQENRTFLKASYSVCNKGKFDYCYAFIQASINALNAQGKLAYLIPGNIFKNQFAGALRELLLQQLTDIYDFTNLKLFKNKLTSSSIIIYDNARNENQITYHDILKKVDYNILKSHLTGKWQFESNGSICGENNVIRFGDMFHAASSIATLLNRVFIINKYKIVNNYILVNDHKIEKSILRRAVSPRSLNYENDEFVIFPYRYNNGVLLRYSEKEFKEKFPCTTKYLLSFRLDLDKRDSDKGAHWFEYGRSQALAHLNQSKLLTSTLITNEVKIYELDTGTIPTSGIYIVPINASDLKIAKSILESAQFFAYSKKIGVISNGNSYRISPKDIDNYTFNPNEL